MNLPGNLKLFRPSAYYVVLTFLVLGVIYFLTISPMLREKDRISSEILGLENRILEQQELASVFALLQEELESESPELTGYPDPGMFPGDGSMEEIISGFRQAAQDLGLANVYFSPDLRSLAQSRDQFLVRGQLSGSYPDFREFMLNLLSSPNLLDVELMEVRQTRQGTEFSLQLMVGF